MAENKVIMAWSECQIEIGEATSDNSFPTSVESIGVIADNTTTLENTDGQVLESRKSGGGLVAREHNEGGFALNTRVTEPTFDLLKKLGLAEDGTSADELDVTTHIVQKQFAFKVTPKNVGAVGIKAPVCNVTYKPGFSDQEGNYGELRFEILQHKNASGKNKWYTRFKKKAPSES